MTKGTGFTNAGGHLDCSNPIHSLRSPSDCDKNILVRICIAIVSPPFEEAAIYLSFPKAQAPPSRAVRKRERLSGMAMAIALSTSTALHCWTIVDNVYTATPAKSVLSVRCIRAQVVTSLASCLLGCHYFYAKNRPMSQRKASQELGRS